MMQAAASLFRSTVIQTISYFNGTKAGEQKSPIDEKVDSFRKSVLLEEKPNPSNAQEVEHTFTPVTAEETKEGTLQKVETTAKETIQNKPTTTSTTAAKYSKVFADQALSRLSKFGLAAKGLLSDALLSPLRAINVPIQLGLGFGLLGQSIYRQLVPTRDQNKFSAAQLRLRSLSVFANAFGSAGASVVPVLGNTIGLITAPTLNTKHFTGKLGPFATKMLGVSQSVLTDHRLEGREKSRTFTRRLSQANNARVLEKLKTEKKYQLPFRQQVKLIFDNRKLIKHYEIEKQNEIGNDPVKRKLNEENIRKNHYETQLSSKNEMLKKGGILFYLAAKFYGMSLQGLSRETSHYINASDEPTKYNQVKQEMQSRGEIRTRRNRSGAITKPRKTSAEREMDALLENVNRVQAQENQHKSEERGKGDTSAPPPA